MAYPWPGFETFLFLRTEQPLWDTDTGWRPSANYASTPILGGNSDSVVLLSYGSNQRIFELIMSPDRVNALRGFLGVTGSFCDWAQDNRRAFLAAVDHLNNIAAINNVPGDPNNLTERRQHIRVNLISQ